MAQKEDKEEAMVAPEKPMKNKKEFTASEVSFFMPKGMKKNKSSTSKVEQEQDDI